MTVINRLRCSSKNSKVSFPAKLGITCFTAACLFSFLLFHQSILYADNFLPPADQKDNGEQITADSDTLGKSSQQERLPVDVDIENSLWFAGLHKKVYSSKVISSCEDLTNWSVSGIGEMSLSDERSIDGNNSIRFKTLLRDEELIKKNPGGSMMGSTQLIIGFDEPQNWSEFNRIALMVYVHPSDVRVHTFYLRINALNEPESITDPKYATVVQNLTEGEWNYVYWEIPNLRRDSIVSFAVQKLLTGHSAQENGFVCYDFDKIELQKVNAEKYEGWDVAQNKIAYSHIGYTTAQTKTAIGSSLQGKYFQLIDAGSCKVVLTKEIKNVNGFGKTYQVMDFTEITQPGKYLLKTDGAATKPFIIADTIWNSSIAKTLNFYYCERCGFDVPGIHPVCHNDLFGVLNETIKQINGGWHDAGDLSQGSFRTNMSIYAMLDFINLLNVRSTNSLLKQQLIDEALWGIDWLLKTRFGNGYRMTWSGVNIYTDGITGNTDDYHKTAQNIPWENFIAAGTEAHANNVLKNIKPGIAKECLQAGIEDWEAAVKSEPEWLYNNKVHVSVNEFINKEEIISHRWFSGGTYLTLSWAVISSLNLYSATGSQMYADYAKRYGELLIECQEQEFRDNIHLTGYFYTDPNKTLIVSHRHPGFEESPLIALANLCAAFPNDKDWMRWYSAVILHSDYYLKRVADYTQPFNMIPASLYRKSDIMRVKNSSLRDEMLKQLYEGLKLSDEYYLRNFPIWTTRSHHGATAVQLSQALALSAAAGIRNNPELENLVLKQMQWVLGYNPFSQSLMYGEGYDYQTLYSYNPGDIAGSLPVGIDCVKNDEPFWSMSNHATFKEVWIVPVSRFLWNAAFLGTHAYVNGSVAKGVNEISFLNKLTGVDKNVVANDDGTFQVVLPSGNYEVKYNYCTRNIELISGKNYYLPLSDSQFINLDINIKEVASDKKKITIAINAEGRGEHVLSIDTFNCNTSEPNVMIELNKAEEKSIEMEFQITNLQKPWIIVITPDGDVQQRRELTRDLLQ